MGIRAIQMESNDNVATVLENAELGAEITVYNQSQQEILSLTAKNAIPNGNKIALTDMMAGEHMIKYGEAAGHIARPIKQGQLVHVHNVTSLFLDIPDSIIADIIHTMDIQAEEVC